MLKAEGLSKVYKMGEIEVNALVEATFEIGKGEFVAVLGPSGSGKSTLLNILGGMDQPTTGKFYLLEDEITSFDEKALTNYRRNQIGFVFQFYNLMSNLTALENVELSTEISMNPLNIESVMKGVGLEARMDHFPAQMSGGEQQRVSIARAIAKNPELLLCDEPTGALDAETGVAIMSLLRKINREMGKTVMVITHNSSIAEMADRVLIMGSGKIIKNYMNTNPKEAEEVSW